MEIDWIIAVGLFLVFVTWAFGYYSSLFAVKQEPLKTIAASIGDRVVDFLSFQVETVPIKYNSLTDEPRKVLYIEHKWPFGKNTTRLFSDSSEELTCYIENSTMFFEAVLSAGDNFFEMVYKDEGTGLNCNDQFNRENESQATPLVGKRQLLVSQARINQMGNMSYEEFKDGLNIGRDFRVELETMPENITFGLAPPPFTNVFVRETLSMIQDSEEGVKIRVLVW